MKIPITLCWAALLAVAVWLPSGVIAATSPDESCALACDCNTEESCTRGTAKHGCVWGGDRCYKGCPPGSDTSTDVNNCGACGNKCNTDTTFNRICVNGQCTCGHVGEPCCSSYDSTQKAYTNSCIGDSGLGGGCFTPTVGCDRLTCRCACVDDFDLSYNGPAPDYRQTKECPDPSTI